MKRCDLCPDDDETCYCYDDKPIKEVHMKELQEIKDRYKLPKYGEPGKIFGTPMVVRDVERIFATIESQAKEIERLKLRIVELEDDSEHDRGDYFDNE